MVFGIIPECRSASLRNERSASPESPEGGRGHKKDNKTLANGTVAKGF
jgi:hypothetical protein